MTRWLLPLFALLGLAACGGQSSSESRAAAGAGSTAASGSGGSGAAAAGTAGGSGSAGAGGAAGHINRNERVACFVWSDVKNQPKPGETGILACPDFSDIDWLGSQGNCVSFADQAPVPPEPGGDQGDCCYHYTYYECR